MNAPTAVIAESRPSSPQSFPYIPTMADDISFAHSTFGKYYRVSPLKVKLFNKWAVEAGYNRSLTDEAVKKMDSRKVAVAQLVIADHLNYEGKVSTRIQFMIGFKGNDKPEIVFIDVSNKNWREFCEKNEPVAL